MSLLRRLRGNSSIGQMHLAVIWYSLHYTTVVTMLLRVFLRADLVPVRMVGV